VQKSEAHRAAISKGMKGVQKSAAHRAAMSKAHKGVQKSEAHRAAISKGMSKYKIPWNQQTHPTEYMRAYRAAKEAEKLVQSVKSSA
jgi:hypothetical protein